MKSRREHLIQSQELKQVQRLILSPQMQQSLHLLQLPVLELSSVIAGELEQNPMLEYTEESDEENLFISEGIREQAGGKTGREEEDLKTFIENSIAQELSLFDVLIQQAKEAFSLNEELKVAEALIGNLDANGFLNTSLEELSALYEVEEKSLSHILTLIQTFDPPGIAARDIREAFLLQLQRQGKERSLAFAIVSHHFEDMVHNRIPLIAKSLHCTPQEVLQEIEKEISALDLHPGANLPQGHYRSHASPIVPDIYIVQNGSGFSIEINERFIPSFRLNGHYLHLLQDANLPEEEKNYIKEKVAAGRSLLRNIHDRHHTLFRIAEELLEQQQAFFSSDKGALRPLTMKDLADAIGVHESTIVRAVASKYLSCPRGIFSFRSFFTHAYTTDEGDSISSTSVKTLLRDLIQQEDRRAPLSDEAISSLIKAKGIPCARRTVVKYRHELGIGNAAQRKSYSELE